MATALLVVGCASPPVDNPSQAALELARDDTRLPSEWREGTARPPVTDTAGYWFVVIELDQPADNDSYPLDVCDVTKPAETFDAIAWQVSPAGDEILAVSPVWGDVTCLNLPAGA